MLTVIIPASNEAGYIGACLKTLFSSTGVQGQAIVVANGCSDDTAQVARSIEPGGWTLQVIELEQGSKPAALNAGDGAAKFPIRVYMDADVTVSPGLMQALVRVLSTDQPRYASGTPFIPRAKSWVTRRYAQFWQKLPFNRSTAPGYGLFAVNAAGRTRWGAFPALISDDTFVRLQFTPAERHQLPSSYDWPMIEGFGPLIRVRRRQDAGVKQLMQLHPALLEREGKQPLSRADLLQLALGDPLGFATYGAVSLAVRMGRAGHGFTRGR